MDLIIWYIICAIIITGLTVASIKFKFTKNNVYLIMAIVCILSEGVKILTHIGPYYYEGKLMGYYMTPAALPFHLCSIFIFLFGFLVVSKDESKKESLLKFMVPIGLLAGLMGVIFASSGTSFTDPSAYQSFIYHSLVVWFSLYFMITKQVKLGKKELLQNLTAMGIILVCGIWVNSVLRVNVITDGRFINFMFLAKPPMSGLPLLNLDHGWYAYFVSLVCVGIVLITLVHLPYVIIEAKNKKARVE